VPQVPQVFLVLKAIQVNKVLLVYKGLRVLLEMQELVELLV
jgi:hypothetical protein